MQYLIAVQTLCGLLIGILLTTPALGIDRPYPGLFVENDDLLMVLIPRTPEQMVAFYEARGFPKAALKLIENTCFVTVHIENKSQRVIWLETVNWRLSSNNQALQRLGKDVWNAQWNEINLPLANRATFGWTQLPAQRDLQPAEPVGGNIVLNGEVKKFNLEAGFMTGKHRRGAMLKIRFQDIDCPKE
ncbi:MAG: hypothetical protein GY807_16095 [Gammaproteobacteria bacterium]|nr:hypothetical protein [Gammaproteobacteria bacterium]